MVWTKINEDEVIALMVESMSRYKISEIVFFFDKIKWK